MQKNLKRIAVCLIFPISLFFASQFHSLAQGNSVGGHANGATVISTVTVLGVDTVLDLPSVALVSLPSTGGDVSDSVASVALGVPAQSVLQTGAVDTMTSGSLTASAAHAESTTTLSGLNILNGLVTADTIVAKSSSDGDGTTATSSSAGSSVTNLFVDGVSISAQPAPNTVIMITAYDTGLVTVSGTVTLNEQMLTGDGITTSGLTVNQIHISVSGSSGPNAVTADVIVAVAASNVDFSVPTAVELINFAAKSDPSGKVYLEWQTGYEVDNLGFNLYRDQGGKRQLINPSLIAGSALLAGANVRLTAGLAYAWADATSGGKSSPQYWLEDVDLHGKSTWHGPISPLPVDKLPVQADALLLSNLILPDQAASQSLVTPSLSGNSKGKGGASGGGKGASGSAANALQTQWDIAAQPGVKLLVRQAGWYRVSQPELVAAGLDASRDPRFLKLFVDGQEIPLVVNGGTSGKLEPTDAIEFYGQGLDTVGTDLRTYYLLSSTTPGLRLQLASDLDGSPTQAQSFPLTIERKDRAVYFAGLKNGEASNWFGPIITATPVTQALNVAHLAAGEATLEVALQGVTDDPIQQPDHQVRVLFNGQDIGAISFDGLEHPVMSFTVRADQLLEGNNTVTLTAAGGSNDISLIDYLRLTYAHQWTADNQTLSYTTAGQIAVTLNGFSSSSLRVIDITDPNNPLELPGHVAAEGGGYAITATPTDAGQRLLYAFADNQALHPAVIQAQQPSSWNRTNQGADVLLITPHGFTDSVAGLVAWRQSQGYAVAVVEIEDLYDEFSYGAHSSQALVDFLQRAKTMWKKAPRYVVLVGDASQDPHNYLGLGANDQIPTRIVNASTMEAASDDALADFDNDGIAELGIGRLPVRTAQEAATVTRKIVDYERGQAVEGTVVVADRNDGFDFEGASQTVEGLLPGGEARLEIFRSRMTDSSAREAIVAAINRGPRVVNYTGHGSLGLWRGNLLTNSDTTRLTNRGALSVVIAMTCLNGLFNDTYSDSLGEALLKAEGGGAVAVWVSSALTTANDQAVMNQEIVRQIYGVTPVTLGEAMRRAKQGVPDGEVRRTWNLLGDPVTKLR